MDKVNKDLSPLERTPGLELDSELDKLRALLDRLTEEHKAKKAAVENSIRPDSTGTKTLSQCYAQCYMDCIC